MNKLDEIETLRALAENSKSVMQTNAALLKRSSATEAEVRRLREALGFAASVIKSGEPWTATCERIIGGALAGPNGNELRGDPSR